MTNKNNPPKAWQSHEHHVESIYRFLDYVVTPNIQVNGQQVDLIAEKTLPGAGQVVLYIDCKHTNSATTNSVSNQDVDDFIASFITRKSKNGWTAGVLVSNRPFTDHARAVAAPHSDIILKTIEDLHEDLFRMRQYLHTSIDSYRTQGILEDYVPLKCKDVDENSNSIGWPADLKRYVISWMNDEHLPQLTLLGEFGSGKTTFLRYLHSILAQQYLDGTSHRVPLFIPLRDYYATRNVKELIESYFLSELGTKIAFDSFESFLRDGRFLLLLDGFDEMGATSNSLTRKRNYLKLSPLVTPNTKIILSCRPSYFVSHKDLEETFDFLRSQVGFVNHWTTGDRKVIQSSTQLSTHLHTQSSDDVTEELSLEDVFRAAGSSLKMTAIKHIQLFDNKQIKAYIKQYEHDIMRKSKGQLNAESLLATISNIYDLNDLATRPILLKLLVNTLPSFIKDEDGLYRMNINGKTLELNDISPSVLYYVYTEQELIREYEKGEVRWLIDRENKRELIKYLAFQMFTEGILVLDRLALVQTIRERFSPPDEELDYYVTDIRTCSFLVRGKNANLNFVHKSFMEYYVGEYVLQRMGSLTTTRDILSSRALPEEILYFLGDSIATFSRAGIRLLHELNARISKAQNELDKTCKQNVLNILNYARESLTEVEDVDIESYIFLKNKLHRLRLANCKFNELRFSKTLADTIGISQTTIQKLSLYDDTVSRLQISAAEVNKVEVTGSTIMFDIQDSFLSNISMSETNIEKSLISDSTFILNNWHSTNLKDTVFKRVLISSTDEQHIKECDMDGVVFDDCIFVDLDCNGDFLGNASFKNCTFIRCKKNGAEFIGRLKGCRGFFIQPDNMGKVEQKGYPFLWTLEAAKRPLERAHSIIAANKKEEQAAASAALLAASAAAEAARRAAEAAGATAAAAGAAAEAVRRDSEAARKAKADHLKRSMLMQEFSWEERLALAFPTGNRYGPSIQLSKVRERIEHATKTPQVLV